MSGSTFPRQTGTLTGDNTTYTYGVSRGKSWFYDSLYSAKNTMEGIATALSSLSRLGISTDCSGSVFLLGKEFPKDVFENDKSEENESDEFLLAFKSIVWLTYRKNFFPIQPPLGYTSDTGWGCMLRSAQMILAETLQRHLGEKWRYYNETGGAITPEHRTLLRWFIDAPKFFSFYSIHRMSECGRRYGKKAGEWYGPNTVALVLRDLVDAHRALKANGKESDEFDLRSGKGNQQLAVLLADNGTIYVEDVRSLCESETNEPTREVDNRDPLFSPGTGLEWSTALFILMPVRLGLHRINEDYVSPLIDILKFPQCVGLIGGKPAHSLYFVGSKGSQLLYLDPHTVQEAATNEDCEDSKFPYKEGIETYHCTYPKFMPSCELDPSLAIGFYCKSVGDFIDLRGRIGQLKGPPFLNVMDSRPSYEFDYDNSEEEGDDDDIDDDEMHTASEGENDSTLDHEEEKTSPASPKAKGSSAGMEDDFVLL